MEKRNVPKLRFKGFEDKWYIDKLDETTYIKGRIGWKNLKQEEYTQEGPYLIAGKHIKNGVINWEKCDHLSVERYIESSEIALQDGDIIFSKDGSLGNPALIKNLSEKATINGTMMLIRLDKNIYYPEYFYQILNSNYFKKLVENVKSGSSIPHIFQRDMIDFKFPMTSLEEQTKIANFLSNVDKIIEEQEGKVKDLELYKKGMMQKIFKKEIRFKDENGQDYPDWKEKKLGELIKYKSERNKENDITRVLSVSNSKGFIEQNEQFEDRIVASSDTSNYKVVRKNDFAFNPSRINVGSIARLKTFKVGIISPMYICFNTIVEHLLGEYLESFIDTFLFTSQVKNKLEGSVRQTLSFNSLESIKLEVPCLEEQTKIAKFLSNIDKIIEEENKKLEDLRKWKKGLLQQMFV